MQRREVVEPGQPVNYALLSLFQYIASVLVILVHCQRLFEHEALHFIQKSMFGRMAVPFFLISSAAFSYLAIFSLSISSFVVSSVTGSSCFIAPC